MSKHRFTPFFKPYSSNRKRVYVSGPMTGYPDNNFPAFDLAASKLRDLGYQVCSPADTDKYLGQLTHEQYLRFDFERVLEADFLVALKGWQKSMGALSELLMAVRMGTKCWEWENFEEYNPILYEQIAEAISRGNTGWETVYGWA